MKNGTITPNGEGGYNITLLDKPTGILEFSLKLGSAALMGAATYAGQVLASKIHESLERKKKEEK